MRNPPATGGHGTGIRFQLFGRYPTRTEQCTRAEVTEFRPYRAGASEPEPRNRSLGPEPPRHRYITPP